jgi:hypothetical protein
VQVQQQPAGGEGNFKTAMELMRSHLPRLVSSRSRSRGAAAPVVLSSAANREITEVYREISSDAPRDLTRGGEKERESVAPPCEPRDGCELGWLGWITDGLNEWIHSIASFLYGLMAM